MNQKNKTIFIIICLLITMIYVPVYITHASPLDENSDIENKNITNTYINNINIENQNINNQNEVDNKTIVNEAKNELINNTIEINNENIVQNKQEIELNNEITDTNQELLTNNITQVYYESESAADVETISTTEATIKAKIFDTNQYTDGVELTSAGITINDWQYSTSKYLQIDPVVPEDDNDYIISIELPKELYFVCDEIPLPTGYSKFEFTKNNPVKINSSTSYNLNAFSGKVEYYMSPTALSGTIQLEIRYDNVLWNKMANTILTPEDVKPIVVKLIKIDSNSEFSNISELRVNKIYSKDKMTLQSLLYYKTTSTSYIGSTNLTTTVDENVSIRVDLIRQSDSSPDMLLDVATFEIQLPYYTDSNNIKHYLNLSNDKIGTSAIKNTSYVIDNSEEGKIIITFTKPYFKLATLFTLNFEKFPEELLLNEQNSFVFSGGKVKLSSIAKDGVQELIYINQGINKITYEKEGIENININAQNGSVSNYQKPEEAVSELGILALSNVGSKDSVEKEAFIEFDINNTNAVKVTSMRLCTDSVSENIEIEYSMVDENGNDIYFDDVGNVVESSNQNSQKTWKCTLKNSTNGVLVYRKVLLESHQQFYFKTLKYRIKTILAGQRLYKTDGMRGVYSGGTIFGFSDVIDNATESIQHKITVTSPNNLEIPAITKTIATVYQSTATPSYYLNTVKFNKTNIIGGDNFIVTGAIQVYPYPYGTTMWLKAPIMGLVLPNGISVNTSAISAKYSNGTSITNITATSKDIDNGNRLWIIKFPQECCIGYYSETLSTLSNGYKIDFSVQLDTSYTINNTAFFANNIYLAGLNQINGSGGAMEWTKKTDIYDLNENGSTTDKIAGLKTSDTTNCQIIAQSATLDLDNNIILNTSGNIGQETTDISTLTKDDTIIYNLDINCNNGGRAEEFLGFIPIPKLNSGRDDYLITSSVENSFELALQDFATITGSDKYNIQYSFETNLTYLKAKEVTTWYTKEEIENNSNLNFKDITMLKLTVKDGTLENGDSTRITLNMKYNGTDYINEVGAKNSWKSVFFYNYINNDRTASGTYTTPEVKATITHTEELSEITLTAAKDMAPINPYNITEKDINYRSLK